MKAKSVSSALLSCVALCLALATPLCCTGCTSIISVSSRDAQVDDFPDDTQEKELPGSINYPSEYLITYEVESEYGTLYQISGGKDAQGSIYFKRQLEEILFVPTKGGYYQYYIDTNGMLIKLDNTVYTQAFVDEMTQGFLEYAQKYTLHQSNTASYTDRTQVAGRDCKVYEINITTATLSQKYIFAIDDETGICMEWKLASKIMNHMLPTDFGFKCTEFFTTDVKLPIPD